MRTKYENLLIELDKHLPYTFIEGKDIAVYINFNLRGRYSSHHWNNVYRLQLGNTELLLFYILDPPMRKGVVVAEPETRFNPKKVKAKSRAKPSTGGLLFFIRPNSRMIEILFLFKVFKF